MSCLSPIQLKSADGFQRLVPCNHCLNCSIVRQRAWTMRLCLEAQDHECASFVTLTYAENARPFDLPYPQVQSFLKRLRRNSPTPVRFFSVGQYGTRTGREHWHLVLYGVSVQQMCAQSNARLGVSRFLELQALAEQPTDLWPHGGMHISEVNLHRFRYVARYSLSSGKNGDDYRVRMSRRPGIGLDRIRQIGSYVASRVPELDSVPGWWRVGKSLYPLDKSARSAFLEAYEADGGTVKEKSQSRLLAHSIARLYALGGDAMKAKPYKGLNLFQLERKELEHGAI